MVRRLFTRSSRPPRAALPRSLGRVLRVIENLLTGALICLFIAAASRPGRRPAWVPDVVRWWHGRLCRALGVRVEVAGSPAERSLLVANHISWLDIPVLGSQGRIGFLSKAEVRAWPLVGWMAEVVGTLFIRRGANQTGEVTDRIAAGLAQGRTLTVFPEGTTGDGTTVRRFHPRLFAIAQGPGLFIQPVALAYRRGEDPPPDPSVPFIGDDTLVANLWRVVRHPDLVAQVSFLPPLAIAPGEDRRALAERARSAIVEGLGFTDDAAASARRSPARSGRVGGDSGRDSRQADAAPAPGLSSGRPSERSSRPATTTDPAVPDADLATAIGRPL